MNDWQRYCDRVKDAADILEVVGWYRQLRKRGAKHFGCCLFHDDRRPSMEVDPRKGLCHCYSCNAGGSVFDVVMQMEGLNFGQAVKFLSKQYHIEPFVADDSNAAEDTAIPDKPTAPKQQSLPDLPRHICRPTIEQVRAAAGYYRRTSLYWWLCRVFDPKKVDRAFAAYMVGGSNFVGYGGGLAVCYPYIGIDGAIVDCKLMNYDPDTGSSKNKQGDRLPVSNALFQLLKAFKDRAKKKACLKAAEAGHRPSCPDDEDAAFVRYFPNIAELQTEDIRADWCNFGDHLLAGRPTAEVCLVESEKTALIASIAYAEDYPDKVWIAVGSKSKLTPAKCVERCEPYRGHKVIIYPDYDGYFDEWKTDKNGKKRFVIGWKSVCKILIDAGFDAEIDTTVSRLHRNKSDDLADVIVAAITSPDYGNRADAMPRKSPDRMEAERVFEEMKQRYPALAEFAERFELEPICVEPYHCNPKEYE